MIARRTRIAVLIGILCAAGVLALGAPAATAQTIPLTYDLGVLMPGETRTLTRAVDVSVTATVTEAAFDSDTASAAWDARLCDASGACTAIGDLAGGVIRAGDYRLVVDLTMPPDAVAGDVLRADGSIILLEAGASDSSVLPTTGGALPVTVAVIGGALASCGVLLLIAGRRPRRAQTGGTA